MVEARFRFLDEGYYQPISDKLNEFVGKHYLTKSDQLLERRKNTVANGVGVFNTATVSHAKGAIITDADGNELIDFAGGIGVVNAGHCPEPVVKAIQEQDEEIQLLKSENEALKAKHQAIEKAKSLLSGAEVSLLTNNNVQTSHNKTSNDIPKIKYQTLFEKFKQNVNKSPRAKQYLESRNAGN